MAQDPTHDEMLAFLAGVPFASECDESDIEAAIYWFANDYHDGQASNLYSALSTSPYSPGPISTLESEGCAVEMLYEELAGEYGFAAG